MKQYKHITINGNPLVVEAGTTILKAAEEKSAQ